MSQKPELIVFSNFRIGGMKSFYENILSNFPSEPLFDIKWILVDYTFDKEAPRPEKLPTIVPSQIFYYTPDDSLYTAAKRLANSINNSPGVIVTNSELELATLHQYRKPGKTIIFVCHDDLYIPLAEKYEFLIDAFIAHNYHYYERLKILFPKRINDIFYLPYGVQFPSFKRSLNPENPLGIILVSRLYESKGVRDLPEIQKLLFEQNLKVRWTIIGNGPERSYLQKEFSNTPEVLFFAPEENEAVLNEIQKNDIFILPSRLDGLPVALLESMSIGCVPIISEFNSGIKKVVTENEGFVLPVGNNKEFVNKIKLLNDDREHLEILSRNCREKIFQHYNIKTRSVEYFNFFKLSIGKKRTFQKKFIRYGSLLDLPFIPMWMRTLIRWMLRNVKKTYKNG